MTHPNLRFRSADPTFCHSCGGDVYPVKDTYLGQICSECRRLCAICEDWLLTDETVRDAEGNEAHKDCADDSGVLTVTPMQVVALARSRVRA